MAIVMDLEEPKQFFASILSFETFNTRQPYDLPQRKGLQDIYPPGIDHRILVWVDVFGSVHKSGVQPGAETQAGLRRSGGERCHARIQAVDLAP